MSTISMRTIFAALVKECGNINGAQIFEWYCQTYKVTAADNAPATIAHEVLGI